MNAHFLKKERPYQIPSTTSEVLKYFEISFFPDHDEVWGGERFPSRAVSFSAVLDDEKCRTSRIIKAQASSITPSATATATATTATATTATATIAYNEFLQHEEKRIQTIISWLT